MVSNAKNVQGMATLAHIAEEKLTIIQTQNITRILKNVVNVQEKPNTLVALVMAVELSHVLFVLQNNKNIYL